MLETKLIQGLCTTMWDESGPGSLILHDQHKMIQRIKPAAGIYRRQCLQGKFYFLSTVRDGTCAAHGI